VTQIVNKAHAVILNTDRGFSITAHRIVFATGYESQQYLRHRIGRLHSTFAMVTEPVEPFPHWPERCLIWETARPYCYIRSTPDNRVMIGGHDTPYSTDHQRDHLLRAKTKKLQHRLAKMFPDSEFEVAHAWAGTFGDSKDGLPYIGQTREWPNAYFAVGYGGNGLTMSVVAAELIRDHYLGKKNSDEALFRFGR
jgi:glycine/D-amino acid oxidase-like deaminating enzyme